MLALAAIKIGFMPYKALGPPTALMSAAAKGDDQALAALVRSGVNVNAQRGQNWRLAFCFVVTCSGKALPFGQTALMAAAEAHSLASVKTLLEAGADADLKDSAREASWQTCNP